MKDLKREIKSGELGNLYLFSGSEKFLISAYEKNFIKAFFGDNGSGEGLSVYEGNKPLMNIIEDAETISLFGSKKLMLIKHSGLFTSKRKEDGEILAAFFNSIDRLDTAFLFIEPEVDKRLKAYKALTKTGKAVFFEPLKESELITWIKELMRRSGLSISGASSSRLVRICGGSMERISKEAEKLTAYKKEGAVTDIDIDTVCTKTSEARVFDLVDAVANGDCGTALKVYADLIDMREQPIGILAMLQSQFSLILKSGVLSKKGLSEREIADKLNKHPYAVKVAAAQARRFSESSLQKAIMDFAKCDTSIKTGASDAGLGVELIIIKYAGEK